MTNGFRLLVFAIIVAGCASKKGGGGDLLIRHVNIIEVKTGTLLEDRDILIRGDSIVAIDQGGKINTNSANQVFNGDGKFVIPGLWDMHAHPDDPEVWRMTPVAEARDLLMPLFVVNGITGIRDMGGSLEVVKQWRRLGRDDQLLVPEIFAGGPLLDGPNPMWDGSVGINAPEDVSQVVDSLVQEGVDFLKVYSLLPGDTYWALASYASQKEIPMVGHVPYEVRPSEAIGLKSQEHLLEILLESSGRMTDILSGKVSFSNITNPADRYVAKNKFLLETFEPSRADSVFFTFVQNQVWHTPTLSMWYKNAYFEEEVIKDDTLLNYLPQYIRKYWEPGINDHLGHRTNVEFIKMKKQLVSKYLLLTKAMHIRGVKLLAGTDMGANPLCFPGWGIHNELELLVKAGLSNNEALKTATLHPAQFLQIDDHYGVVETGKKADLVILENNPLLDIANTRKVNSVIRKGVLYQRAALDSILFDVKKGMAEIN